MAVCEVCGNDYDKPIEVSVGGGESHTGVEEVADRA
jgi:hypothetical protein